MKTLGFYSAIVASGVQFVSLCLRLPAWADGCPQPDLAVGASSFSVSVLLARGDGSFSAGVEFGAGGEPGSLAVGDLNRDGKPDLAVANWFSDNVAVLLNTCGSPGIDLDIQRENTTITVSWPLSATQLVLQSTPNLSLTNWQPTVEAPITNNGRLEVIIPLNQTERFFRLRKP